MVEFVNLLVLFGVGIFFGYVLTIVLSKYNTNSTKPSNTNTIFGVDLEDWHYLGTCTSPKTISTVALFLSKSSNERMYVNFLNGGKKYYYNSMSEYSNWNHTTFEKWRIGERNIHDIFLSEPSKYLRKYMMDAYDHVWSREKEWWVPASDSEKYGNSKQNQQEETEEDKPKIEAVTDNVISVKFGEKKND